MLRLLLHLPIVLALTLLTQIGGLAWLLACLMRRRIVGFLAAYLLLTVAAHVAAPMFGRVPLNCLSNGALQLQSWMYCALNRHYVSPELADVLQFTAEEMAARHEGTVTLVLDANFPFLNGFPMLPHLSYDDGEKADLAFYYRDEIGYLPGQTRSPIGYFAFEPGPTNCPKVWPTLRWDFAWVQPLWPDHTLDRPRMAEVLRLLTGDDRVSKIFLEPHLVTALDAAHPKIRFQGCRAARHDDHIHFQLK